MDKSNNRNDNNPSQNNENRRTFPVKRLILRLFWETQPIMVFRSWHVGLS